MQIVQGAITQGESGQPVARLRNARPADLGAPQLESAIACNPGLRERKKQATRDALAAAAMRLALRRGILALRVEDVAAEAGVSMRTFNNYFSNKYEALTARFVGRMRHAADALRCRPADEALWDAIIAAMLMPWDEHVRGDVAPDAESVAELRVLFGVPAVCCEVMRSGFAANNAFAVAVARRTGTDAGQDLYPRMVAAAVTVATQVAMDMFLRANPPVPLGPLLLDALKLLPAGLPAPSR